MAPVRHTLPKGTNGEPNIFRPFNDGRLYSMVTLAKPTLCDTVAEALGAGVLIWAWTENDKIAVKAAKRIVLVFIEGSYRNADAVG